MPASYVFLSHSFGFCYLEIKPVPVAYEVCYAGCENEFSYEPGHVWPQATRNPHEKEADGGGGSKAHMALGPLQSRVQNPLGALMYLSALLFFLEA